jgi:hypothetical protein
MKSPRNQPQVVLGVLGRTHGLGQCRVGDGDFAVDHPRQSVANQALRGGAQRIDGDRVLDPRRPDPENIGQRVTAADAVEEGGDVRRGEALGQSVFCTDALMAGAELENTDFECKIGLQCDSSQQSMRVPTSAGNDVAPAGDD